MSPFLGSSLRLFLVGSAPAIALLGGSAAAVACTGLACSPGHAAPAEGATVPANAPALPVLLTEARYPAVARENLDAVKVLDAHGREVPVTRALEFASSLNALINPVAPLLPGAYRLVREPVCQYNSPTSPATPTSGPVEQKFTVAAASPFPTVAGTIRVGPAVRKKYNVGADVSCSAEVPSVVVELKLEPSAELAPFLPLARWRVKANGEDWAATLPGGTLSAIPRSYYQAPRVATELFRVCETEPNVRDLGMKAEQVVGEVIVDIPGRGALPPIPFTANLACADASVPDAGTDVGGGVRDAGTASADASRPIPPSNSGGGGCSVATSNAAGSRGATVLALLAGLAAIARRRRPGTS